jgi:hypothetical protein
MPIASVGAACYRENHEHAHIKKTISRRRRCNVGNDRGWSSRRADTGDCDCAIDDESACGLMGSMARWTRAYHSNGGHVGHAMGAPQALCENTLRVADG